MNSARSILRFFRQKLLVTIFVRFLCGEQEDLKSNVKFLGLPRRFASEVRMFFYVQLQIGQPEIESTITLKQLKVKT